MSNKTHVQSEIQDGLEQEQKATMCCRSTLRLMILVRAFQQQHAPEQSSVANAPKKRVSEERTVTHPDPASERILRAQRRSEKRQQWRSEKRRRQRKERQLRKDEKRRSNNEQRLEGQRREFERKWAADARTQSQVRENSEEDNHDQRCKDEAPRVHDRQQTSRRTKTKMGGRQEATETSAAHQEHDLQTGKTSRPTTINEGFHLMSHPISASSFAPPSPTITPQFRHGDSCGVCEDYQTSMEANYLFDPPLRSAPGVISLPLVESAQTREDATDVLFEPSLERSVNLGAVIPRVKIYHAPTVYYSRNGGIYRNIREPHRGRGPGRGSRWRGRGSRGPRDEMS
ncbi:hypothetical protein BGW80DRAFT_1310350 [Lactifluus volemus]|nr:hypothetical protein BGW80DRAFT_1310350 [Lactifluus volemus]